ncbi:hypothetical protein V8E53_014220 [Lactarius tabidus]
MLTGGIYATCDKIITSVQSKKYGQATNYVTEAPENSERCRKAVMPPTTKSDTATDETGESGPGVMCLPISSQALLQANLTRNASSILSRLSCLPTEGATHFRGDILRRPETQVGRGIKRRLWEGTSSRRWRRRTWIGSDFGVVTLLVTRFPSLREKADVLTAVTVKDSAPQGLNQALCSSFAHVTQVHLARQLRSLNEFLISILGSSCRRDGAAIRAHLQPLGKSSAAIRLTFTAGLAPSRLCAITAHSK